MEKKHYDPPDKLKEELAKWAVKLDCGHHATFGHSLATTVVIISDGGGRMHFVCSE
jgi:hypothetical protein